MRQNRVTLLPRSACSSALGLAVMALVAVAAMPSFAAGQLRLAQTDKPGAMQSNSGAANSSAPTAATPATAEAKPAAEFDVKHLFANTCGWCHSNGGREPGKGPRLMNTTITDGEIIYRIKNGKTGYMPAFGGQFNEDQLKAIVAYIRALKPE